jgi:hypothetical protein
MNLKRSLNAKPMMLNMAQQSPHHSVLKCCDHVRITESPQPEKSYLGVVPRNLAPIVRQIALRPTSMFEYVWQVAFG